MKLPVPVNGAFVAYGAVGYGVAPGDAFTGGQLVPRRRGGNLIGKAAFAQIEFATASPLERDGFETSVPGERAYGLNLCLSPYELPFSARSCSAWSARTR